MRLLQPLFSPLSALTHSRIHTFTHARRADGRVVDKLTAAKSFWDNPAVLILLPTLPTLLPPTLPTLLITRVRWCRRSGYVSLSSVAVRTRYAGGPETSTPLIFVAAAYVCRRGCVCVSSRLRMCVVAAAYVCRRGCVCVSSRLRMCVVAAAEPSRACVSSTAFDLSHPTPTPVIPSPVFLEAGKATDPPSRFSPFSYFSP